MQVEVDTARNLIEIVQDGDRREVPLYSAEGFGVLSDLWTKVGWNEKHPYTFTWLGRPVIQLPEDLIRLQEVVWEHQPDVIVETGVAHGGSAVFLAGLCRLLGRGIVVAVDIEIRPHNRTAIEAHPLADLITLIEGDSIAPDVVARVRDQIRPGDRVLVLLDSNHTRAHVLEELEAYAPLVTPGSWIVATDGVMSEVADTPRGDLSWREDNPTKAAADFLADHPEFVLEPPQWRFNESRLSEPITHWPGAWLRRRGAAQTEMPH